MRYFILLIPLLLLLGCVTVETPEATVKTFGAATVVVDEHGEITTESEGLSEGIVGVLKAIPEAVLRILGGIAGGIAEATQPAEPTA